MGSSLLLSAEYEATTLFNKIMDINVGTPEAYKSVRQSIEDRDKFLPISGVRCKVGTMKEMCPGKDVIIIDSHSAKICGDTGKRHEQIRGILKYHPEYLGSHSVHMHSGPKSCMFFSYSALDRVKSPAVGDGGADAASGESGESVSSGEELY